jgi:hypothetical protein
MDEFDLDNIDNIGTSIDKLKSKTIENNIKLKENNNVKLKKDNNDIDNIKKERDTLLKNSKKNIPMELFVKNIENDLENFKPVNDMSNPLASNDKLGNDKNNLMDKISINNMKILSDNIEEETNKFIGNKVIIDIVSNILLFMLLNQKFTIDIFNYILKNSFGVVNEYVNLLIRSLIFGIIILCIKKFNL